MNCSVAFAVITYVPYAASQYYHLFVAFLSTFLLLVVMIYHLKKLIMHSNTKVLLWTFLLSSLLFTVTDCVVQILHLRRYFLAKTECDAFLDPNINAVISSIIVYSTSANMLLGFAVFVELFTASIFSTRYERWNCSLGVTLSLICALVPIYFSIIVWLEYDRTELAINHTSSKDSKVEQSITFFAGALGYSILYLIAIVLIKKYNEKRQNLSDVHRFELSSRFQISSNLMSIQLMFAICLFLGGFNAIYCAGNFIMRRFQRDLFAENYPLFRTLRNYLFVPPLQALSLPLIIIYYHRDRAKKKAVQLQNMTSIPSEAYKAQLALQWGAHSK